MTNLADRRVMITGAGGFLGSHLVEFLRARGVSDIVTPRRIETDLTNQAAARALIERSRPGVVIHLAAEVGGIGANRENPGRYFYANLAMGLNIIEESRKAGVEKLVQVGTVCAYPKRTPVPFHEDDLWNGYPEETNAPYGVAKKALLVMLQGYRQQYGFNGIYLLPANLYGPNDNFDLHTSHVTPALIRKFIEARDRGSSHVEVWGTGSASREFLFVADAARAIALAAERYDGQEPINIGTGREVTIRELAETIGRLTGFVGSIRWDHSKPDGQPRRSLNTERARARFGFEAETDLEDGLRQTIDWWERHGSAN